ncbi:conserved exported hypothetical protein [Candidatus Terasakiella magnetica]|uniref:Uncharacterized protein n=1 Tax=Candidatus Terasakiella magnetica TaxID=1867952 RepID=A0A1C3RLX7_9PROT|nr:hypothetical protein [Candidatus Terasakiella magnetica]SCA58263.1 conserved exported hypothetical protein [Candidatus Terasakiella magnetica]
MKPKFLILAGVALMAMATTQAHAGTLENLERERSMTVKTFLDANMSVDERQAKLDSQRRRLVDLERIVMRDKSLRGKNTKTVRIAFKNYDVTFLGHASAEKGHSMVDHWLMQFGVSTDDLMSTRVGRR